ncbi:uncharacterized protein LOC114252043, partial [Bombyx mandarina]|uniref:Uncharacterized protein LOC114252043 n=1 Tax=Bombyx mandarina TaxID=7092 RepID=A0A6J2KJ09_BOMMA
MPKDRQRYDEDAPLVSNQSLMYVEEAIPKFSGNDASYTATNWAQEVEDNTEIFDLTPIQQLLIARRTLTSTAAAWLRTEKTFKSYDDLKAALFKEFPDVINTKEIHEMMSERKKRKDESCYDYMLEMKALGKRGRLADYVAIQYIIEGILDRETNKIMLYGVTTYPELKEKLKLYETFKTSIKKEYTKTSSSSSSGEASRYRKQGRPAAAVRCFSCGKMNHTSAECPDREKGLKCFRCNEFGHMSRLCLGGKQVKSLGRFVTTFELDKQCFETVFHIVPYEIMPYDIILGQEFLCKAIVVIDKGSVTVLPQSHDMCLNHLCAVANEVGCPQYLVTDPRIQDEVQQLVSGYVPRKVKKSPMEMKIILNDEIPIAQRPRRLSMFEEKEVDKQIGEWLDDGIIRPSFSEYASPLVLVKKKDGTTRICIDYRKLNAKMVKDEFPLPVIEDHIDKLSHSK